MPAIPLPVALHRVDQLEPCQRGTRAARCTKNCFDTPMPVMVPQDQSTRYREAIGTAREGIGAENGSPVRDRSAEPERRTALASASEETE